MNCDREEKRPRAEQVGPLARAFTATVAILIIVLCCSCNERVPAVSGEIRGEPINAGRSSNAPVQMAMAAAAAASTNLSAVGRAGEFMNVGFDKLSAYKFDPSEDLLNPQTNRVAGKVRSADELIPETVKAFDGKRAAIRGFMLPLKVEGGLVTELLIMRDQSMCCYGVVPKINEWLSVKMSGKGVKAVMDQPVTIYGTLHVGEMRENGYLVGIYRLDGEKMDLPEN